MTRPGPGSRPRTATPGPSSTPCRDGAAQHRRLSALLRAGSSVACSVAGDRVFSLERWGHHDQAVLVVRSATGQGLARSLVDPAALTGDPTAAIDWYHPSPDSARVAYGLSSNGDERSTLHVMDVASGQTLTDTIADTRAASVAWLPDASAFAYTRYPHAGEVDDDERDYWRKVFWHRIGTDPAEDLVVWDDLPDKTAWPNVSLSPDGRWMLVHVSIGWSRVDVHLIDRSTGSRTVMIEGIEAVSSFEVAGDEVVGITTLDADRGRVVSAPLVAAWHDNWCTIVAESDSVLDAAVVTPRSLVVLRSSSAVSSLDRYDHDGTAHQPIELGELGSLAGLSASRQRDEVFFSLTSFARPPTLFRWRGEGDARADELTEWSHLTDAVDRGDGPRATTWSSRSAYPSSDGTDVPMFLIRARATVPGPDTPCVLTGYGGFSVTMGPAYSAAVVAVCDAGGLYAVASLRGGAEQGEAWHRAGMREPSSRASTTSSPPPTGWSPSGLTSHDRLAIRGGSNGGLLMGAAITQRPDLCRAAQVRRAAARHGALPPVPHRPPVDPRVRRPRRARRLRLAARVLAVPPRGRRHLLPRGAADHRRGRLAGRPPATPARWRPACRRPPAAATDVPSCCARRPAPATARASR